MKIFKFIIILISIVITMQGCDLKPEEVTESSIMLYESSDREKTYILPIKMNF